MIGQISAPISSEPASAMEFGFNRVRRHACFLLRQVRTVGDSVGSLVWPMWISFRQWIRIIWQVFLQQVFWVSLACQCSLFHSVLEYGDCLDTDIWQGNLTTHIRCVWIFNNGLFYCKFTDVVLCVAKEFWKSISIGEVIVWLVFFSQCIFMGSGVPRTGEEKKGKAKKKR